MAHGVSVHVGLNSVDPDHYGGWDGTLLACEFDARDMQSLAQSKGLESALLLTADATSAAVTDAIERAAQTLEAGDLLFLTYSGHGGQVPDTNGDEPDDARDETWVLYDRQLVDDELYALWGRFQPGVRIFVLSDSCHSGSVARDVFDAAVPHIVQRGMVDDEAPRTKDLPPDVEDETYQQNKDVYEEIQRSTPDSAETDPQASILLISGCQDNQLSLDGRRNGLFTQNVVEVWGGGSWNGTYRRFWKKVASRMPPTQSPNYFRTGARDRTFERQTPLTV